MHLLPSVGRSSNTKIIMSRILLYFLIITSCFVYSLCGVIKYTECTDSDPSGECEIHEVRISPCKEAGTKNPCSLKKGANYSLQMDFTSLQPIETMKSLPYWASVSDLGFIGMDKDACKFTTCPIAQGVNQTYDFQLNIDRSLPRGKFDIKWKFWTGGEEPTNKGCCARFKLKLIA